MDSPQVVYSGVGTSIALPIARDDVPFPIASVTVDNATAKTIYIADRQATADQGGGILIPPYSSRSYPWLWAGGHTIAITGGAQALQTTDMLQVMVSPANGGIALAPLVPGMWGPLALGPNGSVVAGSPSAFGVAMYGSPPAISVYQAGVETVHLGDGGNRFSGTVTILPGSSGYSGLSDIPTSLSGVNATEGAKLAGIAPGATVGATWGVDLANIPAQLGAPAGSGLFLGPDYMGYYAGGAWQTYIDSSGNLVLGNALSGSAGLAWNQAAGTLTIKGSANLSGAFTAGGGTVTLNDSGMRFQSGTGDWNSIRWYNPTYTQWHTEIASYNPNGNDNQPYSAITTKGNSSGSITLQALSLAAFYPSSVRIYAGSTAAAGTVDIDAGNTWIARFKADSFSTFGGLNVGSATGAWAGQLKTSGNIDASGGIAVRGGDFNFMDSGTADVNAVRLFSNGGNIYIQPYHSVYFRSRTAGAIATIGQDGSFWFAQGGSCGGSVTVSGGLNVGSATGAGAGMIRTSSDISAGGASGTARLNIKDAGYRLGINLERSGSTVQRIYDYIGDGTNSTVVDERYTDLYNTDWHIRSGASGTTEALNITAGGYVKVLSRFACNGATPQAKQSVHYNWSSIQALVSAYGSWSDWHVISAIADELYNYVMAALQNNGILNTA